MRILFGFVLSLLVAGNAHAETATGYSRTEACKAATSLVEKAKQPTVKCSCYEWGEKIACKIVPLEQALIPEEEAPEISEQLVTRPPIKETPLISPPTMDRQALVEELSKLKEFEKETPPYGTRPSDHVSGILIGGFGAAVAAVEFADDYGMLWKTEEALLKFEMQMKPGETAYIEVTAGQGDVSVMKLRSLDDPKMGAGEEKSYRTTITKPNFTSYDLSTTPEQKKKDVDEGYRKFSQEQKDIIEKVRNQGAGAPSPAPAATTGPEPSMIDNAINWAKNFLRRKAACDPVNADCKPAKPVSVGGVNG